MAISYPVGPTVVPANLTRPPATYNRRVWLAVGGLLLFVALYALLTGWLGWTAYRLIHTAMQGGGDAFGGVVVAVGAAFLTTFMVKGLFFMKRGRMGDGALEVTAADQPELFAFLHRLADEAGAPRPHRVFLSPRVNASVSYDLSLANLVFPSKKNLEIGLGLVNVLTLGELKAVLAHEFGHFTQRSMAVGRWLSVAQQIAAGIVARRDKLDEFVNRLSRIDFRIAWIGWLLGLIIWAIRSLVDSFFSLALRTQRALSREMEMHADLVAVSLTGSDTLIYALHRLRTADDAWDRTLDFAGEELARGRAVTDLFAVQSRMIDRVGRLLADESYRAAPPLPATNPEGFRVFTPELAQPPRMWSTHPANDEREANAKRAYVRAAGDDRSGWIIFAGAQKLRERISALVLGEQPKAAPLAADAALAALDERFARASFDPRYRGVYLDRSAVRQAAKPADLYAPTIDGAAAHLRELYPESLTRDLEQLRTARRERDLLRALSDGVLEAPGAAIRHRGRQLRRRELPQVIAQLDTELERLQKKLAAHDRRVRTAHRAAAAALGGGWDEYLRGLAAVLHYAEHSDANLLDARRALANRVAIATAGGRVGRGDIDRVVEAAKELYAALSPVYAQRAAVALDPTLRERLGITGWDATMEELKLNPPTRENIGSWLDVVDGWVNVARAPLGRLGECALDQLLATEATIARAAAEGTHPGDAPPPSRVPDTYAVLLPGSERQLQRRLPMWKRFQTADGIIPATARFLVAAAIIGAVLGFGGNVGAATVTIYNGLGRPVTVTAEGRAITVEPSSTASISLPPGPHHLSTATTNGMPVESFDATVERGFGSYVYNVARAATLVEWTQVYGDAVGDSARMLGAPRWTETSATTLFTDPPRTISTSGSGGTVVVLSGFAAESPAHVLGVLRDTLDEGVVIAAHARWDPPRRRYTMEWLARAEERRDYPALLAARLAADPEDMLARRAAQPSAPGAARDSVCARDRALAAATPDNPNHQYLAARCIDDEEERDRTYLALAERWPKNGWLAFAAGYTLAEEARWDEALARLETAALAEPAIRSAVAVDIARLRRLRDGDAAKLGDLRAASENLDLLLALETGTGFEGSPNAAYAALHKGDLHEAMKHVAGVPSHEASVLQLAAASDGADEALVQRALDAPLDSTLRSSELWARIALGVRERRDVEPWAALARAVDHRGADSLLRFIEVLRTTRDPVVAERSLQQTSPAGRGLGYAVGTVILGSAAPAAWRDGAKRLLFVNERPYFR